MVKKLLVLFLLLCVTAVAGFWFINKQVSNFLAQSLVIEEPVLLTVKAGNSLATIVNHIVGQKWVEDSEFKPLLRRLHPELANIKVGTFQLKPGDTLNDSLLRVVSGKEYQLTITFIEGSRFSEWQQQLAVAPHLVHKTSKMSEQDIANALQIEHSKLEGLFLAETYQYSVGDSDLDILRRAHRNLMRVLDVEWQTRQEKLPLKSPYEALILASIIEKETAVASERERVSAVFVNRLNKRMRLQTDPTVIYGMGDRYKGNIRKRDLRESTPYNTYVINGLPPTPIAMAGEASIAAALHPEDSNYLYFVASGTGGHVFSKNLRDHNRAVQQYLKHLRSQK